MQTTIQTPATPGTPATGGPIAAPTTITTTGPDGKTHTVTIQTDAAPVVAGTEVPPAPPLRSRDRMGPGVAVGVVLTVAVVGVVAALKRATRGPSTQTQQLPNDSAQRLERVERGIEAIAIEVERISEGQRFVTKLMSESRPAAIQGEQSRPGT